MLTGEVKALLIDIINAFLKDFQEKRSKITDQDVEHFMAIRKISPMPQKLIQRKEQAKKQQEEDKKQE